MDRRIVFWDVEASTKTRQIKDIGAVDNAGAVFHNANISQFAGFMWGADYICGHNIVHHDLSILKDFFPDITRSRAIDTLYWSPLLFPQKPYHALLKDDKILTDELNNPVNDSKKAKALFEDEVGAFRKLPSELKKIYYSLLADRKEFSGFFQYLE